MDYIELKSSKKWPLNTAYFGDCKEFIRDLPDECIDLIPTSPPYDKIKEKDFDLMSFAEFKIIALQLSRILKKGGIIMWNVSDQTIEGSETGSSFRQALYFKDECGLNLHDTMIYKKKNPLPNTSGNRYNDSFEYMFILSKGKPKTFNPIMIDCVTAGIIQKWRKSPHGNKKGTPGDKATLERKPLTNIWGYSLGGSGGNHPAAFPDQLAKDHIITWSNEGDIIFDPFLGSFTVAIEAYNNQRKWIGCDNHKKHFTEGRKRYSKKTKQITF